MSVETETVDERLNNALIDKKRLEGEVTVLTKKNVDLDDELKWLRSQYAITLKSFFDTMFEVSYQVKKAGIEEIYQTRAENNQKVK